MSNTSNNKNGRRQTVRVELSIDDMISAVGVMNRILAQRASAVEVAPTPVRIIFDIAQARQAMLKHVGVDTPFENTRLFLLKQHGTRKDDGSHEFETVEAHNAFSEAYRALTEETVELQVPAITFEQVMALPVQPPLSWIEIAALAPVLQGVQGVPDAEEGREDTDG